jgi:preprotein translocase subunit SecG
MSVNLLLIFFVLVVVAMIAFILVQKGAGATAGSAFGSGASSTVFGAKGSGNFLTKTTMVLAFLFFAISMYMAVQASKEFTTATTGEVDLGVMGKLDTSTSDVPEITPAPNDATPESDIPSIDVNEAAVESSDVPLVVTDKVDEAIKSVTSDVKDAIEKGVDDAKTQVIEKAEEAVKDSVDS